MNTAINSWSPLLTGTPNAQPRPQHPVSGDARPNQGQPVEPAARAEPSGKAFDVDALVENLWGFMQGRLAEARASGASGEEMEKMWQAAERGMEQGFSEARDALNALGKMTEPLGEKIDRAYDRLADTLSARDVNARAPVDTGDSTEFTRSRLYQYQEQSFALDVTTRDGDRVTIQVQNSREASAEGRSGEGGSVVQWGRKDSGQFDLRIEGDLNERERADLDKLLGEVNDLANEFYDGDLDIAWERAQALNIDGTSLATLDLGLREVETRGVAAYRQQSDAETRLPPGLEPLRQYARDLMDAQAQWQDRLNSERGLSDALQHHPRNDDRLGQLARDLLG